LEASDPPIVMRSNITINTYSKGEALFAEGTTADQGFKAVITVSLLLISFLAKLLNEVKTNLELTHYR
jgi:hypothetical protein